MFRIALMFLVIGILILLAVAVLGGGNGIDSPSTTVEMKNLVPCLEKLGGFVLLPRKDQGRREDQVLLLTDSTLQLQFRHLHLNGVDSFRYVTGIFEVNRDGKFPHTIHVEGTDGPHLQAFLEARDQVLPKCQQ